MPDEALITQIENLLAEIVELGGQNERTAIVPNLTVQDANPTNLSGFLIVSDDRDGDNILAKKVGSVIYSDNDLVNVMFLKGGEAIAFQQGSESANAGGIWEIVPSTTTDIFYDKGQVGINTNSPDTRLEILDTAGAQLRLTHTDGSKFVDFTLDTNHDLTIDPSSTGLIKLNATVTVIDEIQHEGDTDTKIGFTDDDIEFTVGALSMLKLTETAQDLIEIGDVAGGGDVDINFNNDQMFLVGSSGRLGIGTTNPTGVIGGTASDIICHVLSTGDTFPTYTMERTGGFTKTDRKWTFGVANGGQWFLQDTSGSGNAIIVDTNGDVAIGGGVPSAELHVDQNSTTAAQPVLILDQADISEEMIEFVTTIGTGNPIEASGLKLLTPTHFIKVTLPGALTRYLPVGTISTDGPILFKSATITTQGLGANPDIFAFGYYEWSVTDANLDEGTTTQTFGTANISYAAHAFTVTGGAGSTDAGVVGLRVNGTSINDQGTRTPGDTETIIADITAAALDDYQETSKKFLGQVTFELFTVSGVPTVFSLDFNYGLSKYDDWGNTDFTLTDIEAVGFAGANDSNFDIKLMHHQSSGWSYSAAAFTPITAANTIVSLVGDHSTDDQLLSSSHAAWKRDNLSTAINGNDSEGFLVFISSSANNAVEYFNIHVGVVF